MSSSILVPIAVVLAALGLLLLLIGGAALVRGRLLRSLVRMLGGALLIAIGAVFALLGLGVHGYRALTHEEIAARVEVRPTTAQRFTATFRFADGHTASFDLAGDEIYVDAQILKWQPWANVLGLHTGYELSRVAGRYRTLDQERTAPRTVHTLGLQRTVDLFELRRRYAQLARVVDADYGSASFVPADTPKSLELRVSTSGLLFRESPAGSSSQKNR